MTSPERPPLTSQFSDAPPQESPLPAGGKIDDADAARAPLPSVDYIPPTEGSPDVHKGGYLGEEEDSPGGWF